MPKAPTKRLTTEQKRLTAEQSHLAAQYYPFIKKHVRPIVAAYPQYADDLRSAANACLIDSARCYNGKIAFATYLKFKLEFAFKDCLRLVSKTGMTRVPPGVQCIKYQGIDGEHSENMCYDPHHDRLTEDREFLVRIMNGLPPVQKQLCRLVYLEGLSQGEAAMKVGLSKSRVSTLIKESLDRLRQAVQYAQAI
jgi:RNA polymerase sigma factor (sigma-70 family)